MQLHKFKQMLWIRRKPAEVFPFFSDARNLELLTPAWLSFQILTPLPIEMRVGTLIDYRLKLRGVPFRWQTEITEWEPPFRFVDVQKRGPFRKWVHEHRFDEWDQGTLVKDVVTYAVPGGRIVDKLFVRRDVKRIFAHRESQLRRQFGVAHPSMQPQLGLSLSSTRLCC